MTKSAHRDPRDPLDNTGSGPGRGPGDGGGGEQGLLAFEVAHLRETLQLIRGLTEDLENAAEYSPLLEQLQAAAASLATIKPVLRPEPTPRPVI